MSFASYIIIDAIFKLKHYYSWHSQVIFARIFHFAKTINYEEVDKRNLNNIEAH